MKFDVYCDENRPDLLSSNHPAARYMVIGSLWHRTEDRPNYKNQIHGIRNDHKVGGEFKWQKVSPSRIDFYKTLIDWFCEKKEDLRFRCIAVEHDKVDLIHYHDNDQELGFYKFYYQMLHHWIFDFNEYSIFCDFKTNRLRNRLHMLHQCLGAANLSAEIASVQSVRSRESVLLQLTDVLTGAASAALNKSSQPGSAKSMVVSHLEQCLSRKICHTVRNEPKFNVFVIDLTGGW